jgi:hypothetical protein
VIDAEMSEQARRRARQLLLETARSRPPGAAATPAETRFAAQVNRERLLDAHERDLDRRERALAERQLLCVAAETALADRWQALVLRWHLQEATEPPQQGL